MVESSAWRVRVTAHLNYTALSAPKGPAVLLHSIIKFEAHLLKLFYFHKTEERGRERNVKKTTVHAYSNDTHSNVSTTYLMATGQIHYCWCSNLSSPGKLDTINMDKTVHNGDS